MEATETKSVERELIDLERQYWKAVQDRDVEACLRLTDDPCIVVGPQGVGRFTKQAFQSMMEAGADYEVEQFEIDDADFEVRMLNDGVAVVAYKARERMRVDGEAVNLEISDSSTWVKRGDQWVCAMHAEAINGDPFGRDRVKAGHRVSKKKTPLKAKAKKVAAKVKARIGTKARSSHRHASR